MHTHTYTYIYIYIGHIFEHDRGNQPKHDAVWLLHSTLYACFVLVPRSAGAALIKDSRHTLNDTGPRCWGFWEVSRCLVFAAKRAVGAWAGDALQSTVLMLKPRQTGLF